MYVSPTAVINDLWSQLFILTELNDQELTSWKRHLDIGTKGLDPAALQALLEAEREKLKIEELPKEFVNTLSELDSSIYWSEGLKVDSKHPLVKLADRIIRTHYLVLKNSGKVNEAFFELIRTTAANMFKEAIIKGYLKRNKDAYNEHRFNELKQAKAQPKKESQRERGQGKAGYTLDASALGIGYLLWGLGVDIDLLERKALAEFMHLCNGYAPDLVGVKEDLEKSSLYVAIKRVFSASYQKDPKDLQFVLKKFKAIHTFGAEAFAKVIARIEADLKEAKENSSKGKG